VISKPKLLRINLSTGACREEDIPEKIVTDFVGGRGFGVKYLYDELQPGTDPLGPDNKLIFSIGPLAAVGALSTSRWLVTAKSPLTGTYYRGCGGANFGAWMRFAGFDVIIVEGAAKKPVYILIEDGRCEIKDGGNLWGKDTFETQKLLKETHGNQASIACIGPGAERFIRFAGIMNERRGVGRGGLGTVMASKKLKAITIKPARKTKVTSKEFEALRKEAVAAFYEHSFLMPVFSKGGSTVSVEGSNAMGIYPTRNFREGILDGWEEVSAERYAALKEGDNACYGCMVHCGNLLRVKEGPYAGATSEGPDYETIGAFTGSFASNDIATTIVADSFCDRMGIDTITAGNSIGFAFELYERGILTKEDTGGLELTWGNHEAALEMLKMIANRQGLGDILAEGTRIAAERIGKGTADYAMHVNGLELPLYDPRGAKWHGLNYITSPMGANHNLGYGIQEMFNNPYPRPVDRFAEEGYAGVVKFNQDSVAGIELGILCTFVSSNQVPPLPIFCKMISTLRDRSFDIPDFFLVGERIWNLERLFNIREGFSRKDDVYPKRFTTEPLKKAGPSEGAIIRDAEGMLDQYYAARGWDQEGVPTAEKLMSLGLKE